ncbi:tyrosine-type recombinase/integrase [Uruburuella testudinis]|uniref:Tyrosine-type recombinase/integrase n=1 Tax=Uruburuella testudinis TaxID=1282863 RepID=A0ABY4DRC6_9NEIS|nr:tyrosine-type recombinase/integrase [Uruburuella testudinis]UOO81172.1 tyrosine-type recombinase/integrase [Uruburuella testudinis]
MTIKKLAEITELDIRNLCEKIKARGAPSQAVFTRDIFARVYQFTVSKGVAINDPTRNIAPASIARFKARDRALSEKEIKVFLQYLEKADVYPASKKGLLLILLTLVRKGEMVNAQWHEIDFDNAVWQIPPERMKARRPHNVYLLSQAISILHYLKTLAEDSPFVLPGRNKTNQPIAISSMNRAIWRILKLARKDGITIADFTVHDLRRTGPTLLHEQGYNTD